MVARDSRGQVSQEARAVARDVGQTLRVTEPLFVVHAHFYQPPRENPWTEEVSTERSAAPFHDWNERITAECYRPNGWARVVDERGRVGTIINNYAHLSFNVGPTLLSWIEQHHPAVYARILEGDGTGGGAIAQAYNHVILPLANDRDLVTQLRWGLADFAHRFGRPADGVWLPETAVDTRVLAAVAGEGVRFTILAPDQIARVRPRGSSGEWVLPDEGLRPDERGRPLWWPHPDGDGKGVTLVVYDGPLSHELAFALAGLTSEELARRARAASGDGPAAAVATDGETFGHHHHYADRTLAYLFASAAANAGSRVAHAASLVAEVPATYEAEVRLSSWSCAHGVERWRADCGCRTGGEPGWDQRWRAPLRAALDVLRDAGAEVFERRGPRVLRDPWAARDAYIAVVLGQVGVEEFAAEHGLGGDHDALVEALTLLEAQRHALLMYTSCGWFFNDLAGIETIQVLRYAARTFDLLDELDESPPRERFLDVLAEARSNDPEEGDGRAVWSRHVEPARVDVPRVVAHLALVDLLERRESPALLGGYEIEEHDHRHRDRGNIAGSAGRVVLVHRRTRRRSEHVYAAIHLGVLEVYGCTRPSRPDVDEDLFAALNDAVAGGERVPVLLRLIAEGFGPREFGLESALPDAAAQIVHSAAGTLVDRFRVEYDQLYGDHHPTISALITAGYPLPPELRVPAEFALAGRFEAAVAAAVDAPEDGFRSARDAVREARAAGFHLATPRAAATMARSLLAAVERAAADPTDERVEAALDLLRLTRELDLRLDLDRCQEIVYDRIVAGDGDRLRPLAEALGLAPPDPEAHSRT